MTKPQTPDEGQNPMAPDSTPEKQGTDCQCTQDVPKSSGECCSKTPVYYVVFAGDGYYPLGGMDDVVGSFTDLAAARAKAAEYDNSYQWSHIAVVSRDGITKMDDA